MKTAHRLRFLLPRTSAALALLAYQATAGTTWNGNAAATTGNWEAAANWEGAVPTFNATTDLIFRNTSANNRITSVIQLHRTVRSLTFNGNVTNGFEIRLTTTTDVGPLNLTMGDASNPAAITVNSGAAGNIVIGKGTGTWTGNLILANNLTVAQNSTASTLTIDAPITESGGARTLTKTGAGILTLTGSSSFTGSITIDGGTLAPNLVSGVANPVVSPLGNPQTAGRLVTIGSAGTLNFSSSDVMGNGGSTPQLKLVANGGTIRNNGNFFNALGPVDLNGGTLSSFGGINGSFPSFALRGTITVGGSAVSTISSTGANSQIGLGTLGTTFDVADAVAGSDLNVTAVLANWGSPLNAGALTMTGAGTMTLSGTNTYTGNTTVSGGTLLVNGTNTGAGLITVSGGATLGGTGPMVGAVTVQDGNLSSGNSIESLGVGALTLTDGSTFIQEIQDNTATGADLVYSSGNLSLSGTVNLSLSDAGSYTWQPNDKITLIRYTGTLSLGQGFTYGGGNLPDDETFTYIGKQWVINYNDTVKGTNYAGDADAVGAKFITMTVVPEAGTAGLLGLGLLLLRRLRCRSSRA